jgi:hypothetical protein
MLLINRSTKYFIAKMCVEVGKAICVSFVAHGFFFTEEKA